MPAQSAIALPTPSQRSSAPTATGGHQSLRATCARFEFPVNHGPGRCLTWTRGAKTSVARAAALTGRMAFQRGDVFLTNDFLSSGPNGVSEYTPDGQLLQTVPGTAGAGPLCFDPSGRHLIVPGVGMFGSSGNLLPSNWASVRTQYDCVADGLGDVYVSEPSATLTAPWTIVKYDLWGDPVQTFAVDSFGGQASPAIDLAPDECTIYYAAWGEDLPVIGRFNACTTTQEPTFAEFGLTDDLSVLPDWQVIVTDDSFGSLIDASGSFARFYPTVGFIEDNLRFMSLDPDGTSVWLSGAGVLRYDINSGQLLSAWGGPTFPYGPGTAGGSVAVYGPPLFGNASVAPDIDSRPAGTAEASLTRVRYSGSLTRLHLWVDGSTTATSIAVGIYSNRFGRPGTLEEDGSISNVMPGSWNYVDLPSMSVTAGQDYWIAVLGPTGGGTVALRDRPFAGFAELSAQHELTALPAHWSSNRRGIRLSGPCPATEAEVVGFTSGCQRHGATVRPKIDRLARLRRPRARFWSRASRRWSLPLIERPDEWCAARHGGRPGDPHRPIAPPALARRSPPV